jgi:EAL domain-containing protein (putative c-di-GMP-specific phosphodiesterase class I)
MESAPAHASKDLTHSEVRALLERDAFDLWFQPIVCLRTLQVRSFEGLARGRDSSGDLISPARFIPAVESDPGLYRDFTDRMIERAVAFAVECRLAGQTLPITVNLAEASLRDDDLVDRVEQALDEHDIPARQLMFEITEREFINPESAHSRVLDRLSEMGVGLTIDDFGTGWSSLETLRWLPLSQLKIDGGFIDHIAHHAADRIIVEKVIELAHSLHLVVVAEGIERAEQLHVLREVGCDRGQGFLFSPAVDPKQAVELAVNGFVEQGPCPSPLPAPAVGESAPGRDTSISFTIDSDAGCIGDAISDGNAIRSLGLQFLGVMPTAAFVKAIDGRMVWANECYLRCVGASSLADIVELRDIDFHRIDEALRYRYDDLLVVSTGEPTMDRYEFQTRPDGVRHAIRTSKFAVRNRFGTVVGLVGFYVDADEESVLPGPGVSDTRGRFANVSIS